MRLLYLFLICCSFCQAGISQVCPGTPGQIRWDVWQGLGDDEFGELTALYTYPQSPSISQVRYKTQAPINFDNYIGGRMSGFISVPTTTIATFNITGDNRGQFFLSTDADPANMQLLASHENNTSIEEHDKYATQTSVPVTLQAGVDYYFEVIYVENSGADHSSLYWMTDLVDPLSWNIITFAFLKDVGCLPAACPAAGTPCDDGNASTTDDMEDGYCHCQGTASTANPCIAERAKVVKYRYEGIPGSNLSGLYAAANFPAMPEHSEVLQELGYDHGNEIDEIGQLLQGYLTVPVTGNYKFNLTADDDTKFFLSSDEDPANMNAHVIEVDGWTRSVEHDKYPTQTSGDISLVAGQYYYYEINHKEGAGGEHFSVFWQTPYSAPNVWKRISKYQLFDFGCNISCIAAGTPCDDGDPFTNDDQYDGNCECVGTPCSGPDCDDPLASYVPYDKCAITDQLDNNPENNWLSCQQTTNPNSIRPASHWILYDLQERHFLFQSQIWNYNVQGETDKGFESVYVDYSRDGNSWTELSSATWPLASGATNYSGFTGPDFMGAEARYVLITCIDKQPECKGLGKVAFTAVNCPIEGTACDDGNPQTIEDQYNDNCECLGKDLYENDCAEPQVVLGDSLLETRKYSAIETVASISEVDALSTVSFVGGEYVVLDVGFETQPNAVFAAVIDTCEETAGRVAAQSFTARVAEQREQLEEDKRLAFQVLQNRENDHVVVKYQINKETNAKVEILDANLLPIAKIADHAHRSKGLYTKIFRTKKLSSGMYTVRIITAEYTAEKQIMVE